MDLLNLQFTTNFTEWLLNGEYTSLELFLLGNTSNISTKEKELLNIFKNIDVIIIENKYQQNIDIKKEYYMLYKKNIIAKFIIYHNDIFEYINNIKNITKSFIRLPTYHSFVYNEDMITLNESDKFKLIYECTI